MSAKIIYQKIKGYYAEIVIYFPEYSENPEYLPPKRFLWDIFSTKDSNMASKFISHSLKQRNLDDEEGERTFEVSEDVLNQLHGAHYFPKKKGKALFMLSASKELGVIKRKRSFKAFDPLEDKEEKKDQRQKRGKLMEENSNNKITDWLIQKTPKKNKNDKKDKNDRNDDESKENESMKVDIEFAKINNPFVKKWQWLLRIFYQILKYEKVESVTDSTLILISLHPSVVFS